MRSRSISASSTGTGKAVLPAVGVGVVVGVMDVAFLTSFAALLFAGAGPGAYASGAGFLLVGAAIMSLTAARWSSLPGALVMPQDTSTAIVAVALGTLLVTVDQELRFGSALVYLLVSTSLTGVSMLALGVFRRGGLIRFVPMPVIGGFLAGTGYLLVAGGVDVVTGGFVFDRTSVTVLILCVTFAVALLARLRFRPGVMLVPVAVFSAGVVFFILLAVTGTSVEEARALGLLPALSDATLVLPFASFSHADWSILVSGLGGLLTVPLVATLALLLNVSALELVAGEDADLDRELRLAGASNLLASLTGASAGYHTLGLTSLGYRVGLKSRLLPVVVAVVCLVAAFLGGRVFSLLPTPLIGGMLVFLGLGFMADWYIDARRQMSGPEVLLMTAIVAAVASIGFLAAVTLGMLAAVVMFAVTYSRMDPVRHASRGEIRSAVDRPPAAESILAGKADAVLVVELHGFLFFGTSKIMLDRVRRLMDETPGLEAVVVDVRRVDGADSTGVAGLVKLARLALRRARLFVVSDPPPGLASELEAALAGIDGAVLERDLDHALELAEEAVIGDLADPVACSLAEIFGGEEWERIRPFLVSRQASGGEVLIEFGEASVGVVLVERGHLVTEIPVNEGWRRVRSSGPGAVVGEMSLYRHGVRSARVVAAEPSALLVLDDAAIASIEASDPKLAAHLHRVLASILAERVAQGNAAVAALLR